jgi:hypothetical protein
MEKAKHRTIVLGTNAERDLFTADLDIILRSNLLLQANSGGGKSWALRRLIEQSSGKVQQGIIDPEGEFATLRQKHDFLLLGKDGDGALDVASAPLLAHKLLEWGTSFIVDLYEMSKEQRVLWVAAFVQALVDAPKKLWRDLLLYVDEAHEFAPQPGHGITDSEGEKRSRRALVDFGAKGRKRGYGLVAASQRISKVSKDLAAELKNVFVGQTFIDIDRERAAEGLGIVKAERQAFFARVKNLAPGNFYVLGRALAMEPTLVMVGSVATEHPEAGRRQVAPPPPTAKIRDLLPKLAELPVVAAAKVATEQELRAQIRALENRVASLRVQTVNSGAVSALEAAKKQISGLHTEVKELTAVLDRTRGGLAKLVTQANDILNTGSRSLISIEALQNKEKSQASLVVEKPKCLQAPPIALDCQGPRPTGGIRRMLVALAQRDRGLSKKQIAVRAGLSAKSGTFSTYLSRLSSDAYIETRGGLYFITANGHAALGEYERLPEGPELVTYWVAHLKGGAGRMLQVLSEECPAALTKERLGLLSMISHTSGTFSTYLSKLRSLDLVTGTNEIRLSPELE